ncbi:MAG: aldolase/citrate lyase family protein [Pseudomonadota bacterium]
MSTAASRKTNPGNYFEDFERGQDINHAMSITLTSAHTLNALALYGSRLAVPSAQTFAASVGYWQAPISNMVVFHTVFGLSVPDISKNARANLGYADVRFTGDVFPGDTLTAKTKVIGLKENSNGETGIVWVHTTATNQHGEQICSFKRWVMVKKSDAAAPPTAPFVPELPTLVEPAEISVSSDVMIPNGTFDTRLTGAVHAWEDYEIGEKIDHDARVQMVADHMVATRLAGGNNSAVHFDELTRTGVDAVSGGETRGRLIYGGHIMQHAFAQTNNGIENMLDVVAINGGAHTAPTFEGDTIQSYSEVLDKAAIGGREDIALLRLRTVAVKNLPSSLWHSFPYKVATPDKPGAERYDPCVVLDLDYWVTIPTAKSLIDLAAVPPANHRLALNPSDPVFRFEPVPERAIHFFPPHVEKMRGKAADLVGRVDVLLGNFEDGVGPDKKVDARRGFIDYARTTEMRGTGLWTRINALDTEWGRDDVTEVVSAVGDRIDVIMLPMVRQPEAIRALQRMLTVLEAEHNIARPIRIHAILETGTGIVNVGSIAEAMADCGRGHGMSFGPADYAASMGIKTQDVGGTIPGYGVLGPPVSEGTPALGRQFAQQDVWHYHISAMVAACRAHGLKPLYGPFGNFGDGDACRQQFLNAYLMGCEGAWTLHPNQIDIALDVFAPDPADVETAMRRIQTFDTNGGISYYETATGKFVDEAVIKQADVFVKLARQLIDRDPKYAEAYGLVTA